MVYFRPINKVRGAYCVKFVRDVESRSVSLRLRKAVTNASIDTHTVLTDDAFSYVDFWFKKNKRTITDAAGKKVEQNYAFYWEQSKNFYKAAKILPAESAPLPMYYCMLNAMKAYLLYNAKTYDDMKDSFNCHGLREGHTAQAAKLAEITVCRKKEGVFPRFLKMLNSEFDSLWKPKQDFSLMELLGQLPFVHSSYISTYNIPRREEVFIPLSAGECPTFRYTKDNKIHLTVNLDNGYFKKNAVELPNEIKAALPEQLMINPDAHFQLVSKSTFKKKDIPSVCDEYRAFFSYISAGKRLWYIKNLGSAKATLGNLNTMVIEVAVMHRFSEIVRYKPEQMLKLLNSKENWLIHEFLSLALDQFIDEIACEITKQEIMPTRIK